MITIINDEYERSHMTSPRGRGSWAFCPVEVARQNNYLDWTKFSPGGMLLGEAKKWARKQKWPEGCDTITLMP